MTPLERLIADLSAATDQLKAAATAGDWALVERLQKRRAVLVTRIEETAGREPLTDALITRLRALRRQETTVLALATARRQALGEAIAKTKGTPHSDLGARMRRIYRETQGNQ